MLNKTEAYAKLNKLAGTWQTTGRILSNPPININGTDTYEWLPGNFFRCTGLMCL